MPIQIKKLILIFQIYHQYFGQGLIEIYLYYTSPFPLFIFMKKLALANRKIRITIFPESKGRKSLDQKTVNLILEMKKLNPTWGAQRISDELSKIGYKACKKTVLKYLEIYGLNNPNPRNILTWNQFLKNHKFKIGIDFTSLITVLGKQILLFIIIDLDSRRLIYINATFNPDSEWIKQQFRNAFYDMDEYPSLCICDRDQLFSGWFIKMMTDYFEIKVIQTPYRSPEKNGITEGFHHSLKTEAFQEIVPITLAHTIEICKKYQAYYNENRPHQALSGKIPGKLNNIFPIKKIPYKKVEHLNGKITSFDPVLALSA